MTQIGVTILNPQEREAAGKLFDQLAQIAADHPVHIGWSAVQRLFACIIATGLDDKAQIDTTSALLAVDMRKNIEGVWEYVKNEQAKHSLANQPPAGSA